MHRAPCCPPPPLPHRLSSRQVSDLDGTMVGEGEEADACTRDFAAYWEDNAALAGGVLVYNTGRWVGAQRSVFQLQRGGGLGFGGVLSGIPAAGAWHRGPARHGWRVPGVRPSCHPTPSPLPPHRSHPPFLPSPCSPCRSLGQFQGLLEYKAGALPVPDVLITAVGTKIWRLDVQVGAGAGLEGLLSSLLGCGAAGMLNTPTRS